MSSLFRLFTRRDSSFAGVPNPASAELIRRGNELEDSGQPEAALKLYREAVQASPQLADAHFNLGNALCLLGRSSEALTSYRRAVELQPDNTNAHLNLGATLLRCQSAAAAEKSYREALRLRPNSASALTGLGCALEMKSEPDAAIDAFERALAIEPAHEGAGSRLAQLLRERGAARAALEVLDAALKINPVSALLLRTLADLAGNIGEYELAISAYRRLLEVSQNNLSVFSNLLWTLNFVPALGVEEILAEHRQFGAFVEHAAPRACARAAGPLERRLRIGYVSPDFCRHSVSCFIEPLLRGHDRKEVEIHCFHDHHGWDDVTERIYRLTERWHEISGAADEEVARLILDNEIDILVDLAGHTAHNRMRLFAMKPAPLQFTWLGYLCTTGLAAMDYRLCDAHTDPIGVAERWQVEKPARLPDSQWCYQPQVSIPEPSPLPRMANGYWTFGSFNQESKLNEVTLCAWARVLAAIPGSRLRIVGVSCDLVEERIRRNMAASDIAPDRVELVRRLPIDAYFACYRDVDIALDSFPYNGATTTCDALIMGVPVAAIAGGRSIARGGVSLMTTIGLPEWIASSPDSLVDLLKKRTANADVMTALRAELPERMRASALMDGARFARSVEVIFRQAWRDACQ